MYLLIVLVSDLTATVWLWSRAGVWSWSRKPTIQCVQPCYADKQPCAPTKWAERGGKKGGFPSESAAPFQAKSGHDWESCSYFTTRQLLCPALIQLLGSPTSDVSSRGKGAPGYVEGMDRAGRGTGGFGKASPAVGPVARTIYSIAAELLRLVGPLAAMRPVLESFFHRIILYPPPSQRAEALKSLKEVRSIDCTQSLSFPLVIERLERARCGTARETGAVSAALPLARSSLSISVEEKRKGLHAVYVV